MKTTIVISREYGPHVTKGQLIVFKGAETLTKLKTIELPNLDNRRNISCIPPGTYKARKWYSETRGWTVRLLNVPGRDNILIHVGNYAAGQKIDSAGCILPGLGFKDINKDGYTDVVSSKLAMNMLNNALPKECNIVIL